MRNKHYPGTTSNEITRREIDHRQLARQAAAEGFVLLKNENAVLPIEAGSRIALYGAGAGKTIKGGTGSGDVNERDFVSVYQGLKNSGYVITTEDWLEAYERIYSQAREEWKNDILKKTELNNDFFHSYTASPFHIPCGDPIEVEAARNDGADTAVFVLSRIAGENADRRDAPGDYYITDEEKALLDQISEAYESIVLVINTGGPVDLGFTEDLPIKAILLILQPGQEGGNAFADILSGKVTPSGKLTDSWAVHYEDYPNAQTFSYQDQNTDTEKYAEGIYVGYRYFDTFQIPVRYGFGFGLSYTTFSVSAEKLQKIPCGRVPAVRLDLTVKNTGARYSGKEVVQIYVSCPQTDTDKEFRRLAAFAKTALLAPFEAVSLSLDFSMDRLTSYDEGQAAWTLEKGCYGIWAGSSLDSSELVGIIRMDENAVVEKCEHICPLQEQLTELAPDREKLRKRQTAWTERAAELSLPTVEIFAEEIHTRTVRYPDIPGKLSGRAGELVDMLSEEQLIQLTTGDPGRGQGSALGSAGITVPGAAAETSSCAAEEPWNIPSVVLADGPAGLRLNQTYRVVDGQIIKESFMRSVEHGFFADDTVSEGTVHYQYCTAVPIGTLLAQSWNPKLLREIGKMIGHEMEEFGVTLWLAPGMNIHRNPLCGRNFEYYSEDPLLSGLMAAAVTEGVQTIPGIGTTIKHFACNNQEDNRMGSDSVMTERTLREIYLKGFEIAVKESQPLFIMTSYNMLNGVHTANSCDLCKKAARDEWGFAGGIMTDWTTTTHIVRGTCTASGCIRAGNDLIMPGAAQDHENIRRALASGELTLKQLKWCVWNTVRTILRS